MRPCAAFPSAFLSHMGEGSLSANAPHIRRSAHVFGSPAGQVRPQTMTLSYVVPCQCGGRYIVSEVDSYNH